MDPRPMRADARRNYERLITTARAAFMEHGTGASLDDIARRAGVGSGTLYRHFPTRDDLLDAVLRDWITDLLAHAETLLTTPGFSLPPSGPPCGGTATACDETRPETTAASKPAAAESPATAPADAAAAADAVEEDDAGEALARWLRVYLTDSAAPRGTQAVLVEAMSARWAGADTGLGGSASAICDAAARLLARAQEAGAVREEVDVRDLLRLTNAIGMAAERTPDPVLYADRMLALVFTGLRPA